MEKIEQVQKEMQLDRLFKTPKMRYKTSEGCDK